MNGRINGNELSGEMLPESVTIALFRNGKFYEQKKVTAADDWSCTFTDLPQSTLDPNIYTVAELAQDGTVVEDGGFITMDDCTYKVGISEGTDEDDADFIISNVYETIDIKGSKKWDDDDDNDAERPESVTIRLMKVTGIGQFENVKEVILSAGYDGSWGDEDLSWSFTDLPKYDESGNEISYYIVEESVDGYTATYNWDEDGTTCEIVNTHTPDTTGLTVFKEWADDNNRDGKRAEEVTVLLYADEEQLEDEYNVAVSCTLSDKNDWTYTFTDLPAYKDGVKIEYSVGEVKDVNDDYTTTVTRVEGTDVIVIQNEYHPKTTEIEVQKFWEDGNNQDGIRPESIDVTVTGTYTYTDEEGDEQTGVSDTITRTITADDDWTMEFNQLPIYYPEGLEITYTVSEVEVEGYETKAGELKKRTDDEGNEIDGSCIIQINNKHVPETTEVTVDKIWVDGDNEKGTRPDSVAVQLYADGEPSGSAVALTNENASDTDNTWTYTWEDLPKYADGKEISYTVAEVGQVDGYQTKISLVKESNGSEGEPGDDDDEAESGGITYNIVNSLLPTKGVISVTSAEGTVVTGDVSVGDTITYTISYANYNDTAATVTITDELDEGLNYVSSKQERPQRGGDSDNH